jgi:hypothetical protein
MKTILLLVLFATAAHAEPAAKCEAKGTPIFEIYREDSQAPKALRAAKLYDSGAWKFEETDTDGKKTKTDAGCLAADAMKTIKAALADAKWKVTTAAIHCNAISPKFTVYKAHDTAVFEAHVCGGKSLDDASQKAVTELEKQLEVAFPKP